VEQETPRSSNSFRYSGVVSAAIDFARPINWQRLTGFVATLFVIHRFISSLFYSRFGIAPEEVGVGYAESLLEAAVVTFILVVALNAIALIVLIVWVVVTAVRAVRSAKQMWHQTKGRGGQVAIYIGHRLAIAALFVGGVWWSEKSGRWLPVIAAALACGTLADVSVANPFARETGSEGAQLSSIERESERRNSQRRLATRIFQVSLLATLVLAGFLLVGPAIHAGRRATDAQKGTEVEGFPFTAWRAQRATVSWLVATPPPSLANIQQHCLMYLGQANGVAVLYDVDDQSTLRVSVSELIVSTGSSAVGRRAPCRSRP
jgi:hypothetical protein